MKRKTEEERKGEVREKNVGSGAQTRGKKKKKRREGPRPNESGSYLGHAILQLSAHSDKNPKADLEGRGPERAGLQEHTEMYRKKTYIDTGRSD